MRLWPSDSANLLHRPVATTVDYGLSQLTTAFSVGACAVLHDYLLEPGYFTNDAEASESKILGYHLGEALKRRPV